MTKMCRKKKEKTEQNSQDLIFLNMPIGKSEEDVVGFDTHVAKIDAAINNDAQMIALTSPFGTGKTSIVELLQEKFKKEPDKQIVKIPMWMHLGLTSSARSDEIRDTTELHRTFVYQLISQLNPRKGLYISKKLNPSYGVLKVSAQKRSLWICLILSLMIFLVGYVLPHNFGISLPWLSEYTDVVENISLLSAVALFLVSVTQGEIVFSSNKSEGGRKIDTNEIIQLYRTEVLKYRRFRWMGAIRDAIGRRIKRIAPKKYIVVIEDLDRTDSPEAVIAFLKELRRYYVPELAGHRKSRYVHRTCFLVNVKPEACLGNRRTKNDEFGQLYAKLFDYIINLQTINIDDYETVLESILLENKEKIKAVGIEESGQMIAIPGMRWIIRGKHLGIREIKERLNIAFSLYESLKTKFPEYANAITFEKCAVVAYVKSEFEKDFYETTNRAFQDLVDLYLQNKIVDETLEEHLSNTSKDYIAAIKDLVQAGLIDNNYRMYFYNYPKGSRIYTTDELIVQKAILYEEFTEALNISVEDVLSNKSDIIEQSFKTREELGLQLPSGILKNELLYIEALKLSFERVKYLLNNLDYAATSADKTIELIKTILDYDKERKVFSVSMADQFCSIFENKFSEEKLSQLRKVLCRHFPDEITWYSRLFGGTHRLITVAEMDMLSVEYAVELINMSHENFGDETITYIADRFFKEENAQDTTTKVIDFMIATGEINVGKSVLLAYLKCMKKIRDIVPELETIVVDTINSKNNSDVLFEEYQAVINIVAERRLPNQTLANIAGFERYSGYSSDVTAQMGEVGYWFDYTLQHVSRDEAVPFEKDEIAEALEDEVQWLLQNETYFNKVRRQVIEQNFDGLLQYKFLFATNCPIMKKGEFDLLRAKGAEDALMISLIPPELVMSSEVEMLKEYFCRVKHRSPSTYAILIFIAKMKNDVAKKLFYSLNFDYVKYRDMSAVRKNDIKTLFNSILALDTHVGRVEFMKATKCIDSTWEANMRSELKTNKSLRDSYIAAVNSSPAILKSTITTLCNIGFTYKMNENIIQRLYEEKCYEQYVACRTYKSGKFEIEDERLDVLWPVYEKLFKGERFPFLREHMIKNRRFLDVLMRKKAYEGMAEDRLLPFSAVLQSKDILEYIVNSTSIALKYLEQIKGFENKDAAAFFVDTVENRADLLKSDAMYKNGHEKLLDGLLKRRYTLARKKHGYLKNK